MPLTKPAATEYAPYYDAYIRLVPAGNVLDLLAMQREETLRLLRSVDEARAGYRYAPGKWSMKEVVGHLNDTERVFTARALHFARGDQAPLPGYEQDDYAVEAKSDERPWSALVDEFDAVRRATVSLFHNLPLAAWERRGTANEVVFSVRSIAHIIAGHERHHERVLRERYLR